MTRFSSFTIAKFYRVVSFCFLCKILVNEIEARILDAVLRCK